MAWLVPGIWLIRAKIAFLKLGILAILASFFGPKRVSPDTWLYEQSMVDVSAESYSSSALRTYVDDGHSVFINMTADWCITCKVTEKRLLATEPVDQLFETHSFG